MPPISLSGNGSAAGITQALFHCRVLGCLGQLILFSYLLLGPHVNKGQIRHYRGTAMNHLRIQEHLPNPAQMMAMAAAAGCLTPRLLSPLP